MNYKTLLSFILITVTLGSLSGQNSSETRNFIKTVAVSKETSLEIFNKYGSIQVTPWKKDSAYIRAEVKASGPNREKLSKMFDGIDVNIRDSKYVVRAETEFTQNMNTFFESFKGMTSKLISYDSKIEINYYISIPEYLNLKIENRYGDVYVEDVKGTFSISLSNGSFKANSLGKSSDLTLTFCDATINSIASGRINSSFSEINVGETEDLYLNSISSKFDIKKAGIISVESRRDKLFLGTVDKLRGSSYFTDFRINSLKTEINVNTKYGNLNADKIEKGFESVDITSGYTDVSLEFDPSTSYNVDIRHINSFIVLPDKDVKTERKALNEDKREYMTFGTVGKNPGNIKVKIDATRGNIYLR